MNVRPLHNIVIIEKLSDEKYSPGGIKLIKEKKDQPRIGKVLKMGPGVYDDEGKLVDCGVKVGDRVAYLRSHEKQFNVNDEIITCIMANGILGVLKDGTEI